MGEGRRGRKGMLWGDLGLGIGGGDLQGVNFVVMGDGMKKKKKKISNFFHFRPCNMIIC